MYLYDEMTRREGAPLRATMPDWIIQNCLHLLREREREAEAARGSAMAANSAVAAAALEAASANSGSSGSRPAPHPPTKGAQTLHAHQVQLHTVYRPHVYSQNVDGIAAHSSNSSAIVNIS